MPPLHFFFLSRRSLGAAVPSSEFLDQWTHPGGVFSVLLILGGDVVGRALAQLAGPRLTPVSFSFGWVAYAVTAVVSAIGENKLMPSPDCACVVINGKNGYVRHNASWVIGRIVRDFESWMDQRVRAHWEQMLEQKWQETKIAADQREFGSSKNVPRPSKAGLCVSIYKASIAEPGIPRHDKIYHSGFLVALLQLGIAAIPCGLFGDWSIMLVTGCGILLAFATGSLPQWSIEKWACRRGSNKSIVLTRGNGDQHAIVILGEGRGLDLEDLAAGPIGANSTASTATRTAVVLLAIFWTMLLATAAGIKQNTWFLLAVGGIGIIQNIIVAGSGRSPGAFGVPLTFQEVIGETKAMKTLFAVEESYPHLGKSMLDTFFPGEKLCPEELSRWADLDARANNLTNKVPSQITIRTGG